ncbi:MAG: S8 family serine peptidase, partial [Planctomycetota bacterium]
MEQIVWQGRTVDVVRGEVIVRYESNGLQGGQAAFDVAQPAMLTGQDRVNQLDGVTRAFADVDHEGLQVERHLGSSGLFLARGTDTLGLIADLKATPGVTFVEPNFVVTKSSTPNDPSFDQLWGLHQSSDMDIDALEAWGISTGSPDVITAVVDTGIDYNHPDLVANMWTNPGEIAGDGIDNDNNGYVDDIYGIDTAYGDSDPYDGDSHGTHVAGTIAATGNNGVGVVGVAYGTKVMALKFLDDSGFGDTADAVEAINYITDMRLRGVNVVASNNSWGGGGYSQTLYDAIEAHNDAGLLFVAAAGNGTPFFGTPINNDADPQYPASYDLPGIISVANHQSSGAAGSSSNYGATSVDIAAPGTNVLSSVPGGGYSSFTGTSMASPHVAGVVALVNSVAPGLPIADVKAAVLDAADPIAAFATTGSKPILTGGRLNAFKAIEPLGSPGLYGTVFDDIDGDGVRSGNEPALSGRTVYIDLDNDSVIDANEPQTLTALDGRFGFESLATGTYTVKLAEEAGRRQTLPASVIAYAAEGYDSSSTFASTTSTLVNGRVFNDVNGNGLFDAGEDTPLSGERIYLDADGDNDPGIGVIEESATVNSPITDYNTTLGTVAVAQTGVIDTLSVTVNLSHTYTGDLDIFLISPDGTEVQ